MINRIIIALASILSSGVLAYAHLISYWESQTGKLIHSGENIHLHSSFPVLKDSALLTFGLLYFSLFLASTVFALIGKSKVTFGCFVGVMVLIWVRMWMGVNG